MIKYAFYSETQRQIHKECHEGDGTCEYEREDGSRVKVTEVTDYDRPSGFDDAISLGRVVRCTRALGKRIEPL